MRRRRHEPHASSPADTELDRLLGWVLSLPWVVERSEDAGTPVLRSFWVDCEPLGRRQAWLLTGVTSEHASGIAVVVPVDAAAAIVECGWGHRFAQVSDEHVLVALTAECASRRHSIETVVLSAYGYAMS